MIRKSRILSMMLVFLFLFAFSTQVLAQAITFPDIQDAKWDWARPIIEDMSIRGYIAGYDDGTFGPSRPVTKIQSLILLARIMGVNENSNKDYVNLAEKVYISDLQQYNTPYKKEISYLLYKNILKKSELDTYLSKKAMDEPLKRYEAAILFTKAMGKEEEVKQRLMTVLSYKDVSDIPAYAHPYVWYVNNQEIMMGISETEFAPLMDVSRAQMAVMLYRVLDKKEAISNVVRGRIVSVSSTTGKITVSDLEDNTQTYIVDGQTILRLDGKPAELSSFTPGMKVQMTVLATALHMVEGLSETEIEDGNDNVVSGEIKEIIISSTPSIKVAKNGAEVQYPLAEDVAIVVDGRLGQIYDLRLNCPVELIMSEGRVIRVKAHVQVSEQSMTGIVQSVHSDFKFMNVSIINAVTGEVSPYQVFIRDATKISSSKDSSKLLFDDIKTGDIVTIKGISSGGVVEASSIIVTSNR